MDPEDTETPLSEKKITVNENGPLKVEGDLAITDHQGNPIPTTEGRPYHLCRCGASENKPFCDGSHKKIDFDGS